MKEAEEIESNKYSKVKCFHIIYISYLFLLCNYFQWILSKGDIYINGLGEYNLSDSETIKHIKKNIEFRSNINNLNGIFY